MKDGKNSKLDKNYECEICGFNVIFISILTIYVFVITARVSSWVNELSMSCKQFAQANAGRQYDSHLFFKSVFSSRCCICDKTPVFF